MRTRRCISAALTTGFVTALALTGTLFAQTQSYASTSVHRESFTNSEATLTIEFLDDDLVHFELAHEVSNGERIFTTSQVSKTDYAGPTTYGKTGNTMRTGNLSVTVDQQTLCVTTTDITKIPALTLNTTCPRNLRAK